MWVDARLQVAIKSIYPGFEPRRVMRHTTTFFCLRPFPLQRNTPVGAVLDKQAAIDQALVKVALLVASVDDVARAGRLLEDADLVLALARVVVGDGAGDALERVVALGVVHLEGAGGLLAADARLSRRKRERTYFLLKSKVMAKFCQSSLTIGVDQICLFLRSNTFHVSLARLDWPRMAPASKLNWLAE